MTDQEDKKMSLDDDSSPEMITLVAQDRKEFQAPRTALLASRLLSGILEDPACTHIELDKVNSRALKMVLDFMIHHEKHPVKPIAKPMHDDISKYVSEWDAKFIEGMNQPGERQDDMFELMLVANYMCYEPLLLLCAAVCASTLKGRTPAEIRKLYGILDPTPEEEEAVRKEYADLLN